jgi:hypothetical protein
VGDLVKINTTTCSYFEALIEQFGGGNGRVFQVAKDGYVIVSFPTGYKMLAKELLEVIK